MLKVGPSRPALVLGTVGVLARFHSAVERFLAEPLYGVFLS